MNTYRRSPEFHSDAWPAMLHWFLMLDLAQQQQQQLVNGKKVCDKSNLPKQFGTRLMIMDFWKKKTTQLYYSKETDTL